MASNPASAVIGLTVGENDVVGEADQQAATVIISGTLSAPLEAGDSVEIVLPSGYPQPAIVAADGTDFSLVLTGTATIAFGLSGQISAYVVDSGGNQSTPFTTSFVAAAARTLVPISATPTEFAESGASALALSGDGKSVAFVSNQVVGNAVQFGLYVEQLDTGTLTLISPDGRVPSLSADGNLIAYQANQNFTNQVFLTDLTSGLVTQLSDPAGGSTSGPASTRPGIATDGTVVFESAGDTSLNGNGYQQVFFARVAGGVAGRTLISAAADGTPGNGTSEYATISADGSTIVFLSRATNLLGAGDPHAAALDGTFQIYAFALRDNAATGQRAGTTILVSFNPDGTISDGTDYNPVVSGDGRFVLFQSASGNSQVSLTDLLTGVTRIVSTNANGDLANAGVYGATLSADGNTVVFQSTATNLLDPGAAAPDLTHSQQVFAKNLTTGQVTLLSEGGYVPGDAVSQDPAVSADGTVAAFASTADNLTPGVLGAANRQPMSRGYVTAIAGTAALAITPPPATIATTTLVLTGTIDDGHAETPITITDAADPGFLPVIATVAAGSDPYLDTWTATIVFTQARSQTVTVTAGAAAIQTTLTVLNAPALTIDPVNGTNAIAVTGQPGHVTLVTGTNPDAIGSTVSLFLRNSASTLLPLGTAITGADGTWSISVPDTALGSQSSESDALVAETVDGDGTTIRAAQGIALSVAAAVTLYGYRFTFADGSFYTGTVADDGTYGYTQGKMIATGGGFYVITASAGTTTQPVGTVTAASYFDVSTSASYTPTAAANGAADGAGGLGSETDSITGPAGLQSFGGGVTEARQSAATAYDFSFVYNDGSAYFGTVVSNAAGSYKSGQVLSGNNGFYRITGSAGASTAAIGTVNTSLYYDATSAATYVPVLYSQNLSSGTQGLGSEVDTISSSAGPATNFGLAGADKAALRLVLSYSFQFYYADGSVFYGYVVDDGTYGYSNNETIKVLGGTYKIVGVFSAAVSIGGSNLTPGEVSVYSYYDKSSNQYYTPGHFAAGEVAGFSGLGSEIDYTTGFSGNVYFGSNGTLEARQVPNQLYFFTFTYKDGSSYSGSAIDDGSYGYYAGETITTPYGHYSIRNGAPLTAGEGGLVSGQIYTRDYYDITSGGPYVTLYQAANLPSGSAGLGSEDDGVLDTTGVYQTFGEGGRYEARLTPYSLYDFEFTYKDGSYFMGQISSDGVHGPLLGQVMNSDYGFFSFYYNAGATGAPPGTITIQQYYDVTDNTFYVPHTFNGASNYGTDLALAVGYTDGLLSFGYSGELEARHAPNTLWNYEFVYQDGAHYSGQVVGNDQSGFRGGFIQYTPYGFYYVFGSAGMTSLPVASVTISSYFDITTATTYPARGLAPQGIGGTSGLGSEYAYTTVGDHDAEFGFGGALEAKQSSVYTYSFTFRYTDGTFYSGTVSTESIYTVGATTINVTGGYYFISGLVEAQSSNPSGTVSVSSYFATGVGFYTPVRYSEGKSSGTAGLGSEIDYIAAGGGLRSFGGPTHIEANTSFNATILLTTNFYAFDGPIQGATIGYLDPKALPGTLGIDPAQPSATTNADGSYQLAGGTGPFVLTGGIDTATRLAFTGALESAGTGSVLSPVTTLLEAVAVARGDTSLPGITAAEAILSSALGLPSGLDLTSYLPGQILRDPATSPNDVLAAEAVYRAGAALLDAETLIDAAGGASQSAIATLAEALADGSVTDVSDLYALIEDGSLAPAAETAIKTIVTATDAALDQQLAGVTAPTAILALISGASILLQGNAAITLAATDADDTAIAETYVMTLPAMLAAADQQAFDTAIACYCRGTSILTASGEMPVEALRIGDRVMTASGMLRPIRWIGHRSYDGRFVAGNRDILPIRIRAGALADGVPIRDLFVSPRHAMLIGDVLIPAERLENGVSILRSEHVETVSYFHIELDTHDILLAEGAPSESFVDCDSRGMFQNAHEFAARYPDDRAVAWAFCAPRVEDGAVLARVRRDLAARAGLSADHAGDAATPGKLAGSVDVFDHRIVSGWAFDAAQPHTAVRLAIWIDGAYVAECVANGFRADLRQAGKGAGRCAFSCFLPHALPPDVPHRVVLRRVAGGAYLTRKLAADPRCPGPFEGYVETCTSMFIDGWALDAAWPATPVRLEILTGEQVIGTTIADQYRPDLARAGKGSGHCRFVFWFERPCDPGTISVRRATDGITLPVIPAFSAAAA